MGKPVKSEMALTGRTLEEISRSEGKRKTRQ